MASQIYQQWRAITLQMRLMLAKADAPLALKTVSTD